METTRSVSSAPFTFQAVGSFFGGCAFYKGDWLMRAGAANDTIYLVMPQGKVKTIIETYPLAQAPKAYDRVAEGKARFRATLTM
jgi:hypothetical protein